jgi:hypothetical protein
MSCWLFEKQLYYTLGVAQVCACDEQCFQKLNSMG